MQSAIQHLVLQLTCQPGWFFSYMYKSLSGFLTICPDIVLTTLLAWDLFLFPFPHL